VRKAPLLLLLLASRLALAGEAADFAEARLAAAEAEPLHRSEHVEAAIARLVEPKDARDYSLLARAYLLWRAPETANGCALQAWMHAPRDPAVEALVAETALATERPSYALSAVDSALAHAPPPALRAALLRNRARAHLRCGDFNAAREDAHASLEIEAASADGRSLAAWCERRAALAVPLREHPRVGDFDFFVLASPDDEEAARRAASRIAAVAPAYARRFPPRDFARRLTPVTILSASDFARVAPPGPAARGFYQRDEQAVFVLGEKKAELERLLAHECFHAQLARLLEDAPAWLDEGYADYFAGLGSRGDAEPVRRRDLAVALAGGRLISLADLASRSRQAFQDGPEFGLRQAAAWGFVHFFREKEPERLDRYVERLLTGASPEEAFQAAFGDADLVGIESRMRAHVLALPE
jgi:hypothetical protein